MQIATIVLEQNTGKLDLYRATVKSSDRRINGLEGVSQCDLASAVEDLVAEIQEALA